MVDEGKRIYSTGELKFNRKQATWASCKGFLTKSTLLLRLPSCETLTTLVTEDDIFLLAEKLATLLHGSHSRFAHFLDLSIELFLTESPRNDVTLVKRLLYTLCECFHAASNRSLWMQAGLTLCALAVVEGASLDLLGSRPERKIVFRSESFIEKFHELSSAAVDEFDYPFLRKSAYYTKSVGKVSTNF